MTHFSTFSDLSTQADLLYPQEAIQNSIKRLARQLTTAFEHQNPIILTVMQGGMLFAAQLVSHLAFPVELDYVQVSRYHNGLSGTDTFRWLHQPSLSLKNRIVLMVDDILDEGHTLVELKRFALEAGAAACYSVVLTDKQHGRPRPLEADFVGLTVPDRYVFGYGMDIAGQWRHLPSIFALKTE